MTVRELIDQLEEYGDHHEVCVIPDDEQKLMKIDDVTLISQRGVVGLWMGEEEK